MIPAATLRVVVEPTALARRRADGAVQPTFLTGSDQASGGGAAPARRTRRRRRLRRRRVTRRTKTAIASW